MPTDKLRTVTICCGGGTDSTALIPYYSDLGFEIRCVHFDYGQAALSGEREAVGSIVAYYQVPVDYSIIRPKLTMQKNNEYPGRNALFVLFASRELQASRSLISLGIHAGTPYYDCGPAFVDDIQHILDGYFNGLVTLDTPFLHFTKEDIYEFCHKYEVPVDLTYSCQQNPRIPCGKCQSCLDRRLYDPGARTLHSAPNKES